MNDPILYSSKFKELLDLACKAETAYEKAVVFAATQTLADAFFKLQENYDGYILEKVEQARWHICALIGYDITNGRNEHQIQSDALGAIDILQRELKK